MNKKRTGAFLRILREEKGISQENLAAEFSKNYLEVSRIAIINWEKGKTIPNIDKLIFLANYYEVSMDEILDGERYEKNNLLKTYFLAKPYWYMDYSNKDKEAEHIYRLGQQQIILIKDRFHKLLRFRIYDLLPRNEEREFEFLATHFYGLTEYSSSFLHTKENNPNLQVRNVILNCLESVRNMDNNEKYWELEKLFIPTEEIEFNFRDICGEVPSEGSYIDQRFKSLEPWEKDRLFNTFQICDLIQYDPSQYGSQSLKRYNENHDQKFDREKVSKSILRYMIENGACLNKVFQNVIFREKAHLRMIDRAEYLFNLCLKPIEIIYRPSDSDETKHILVENNAKNRFISKYYYSLYAYLKNYSLKNLYNLFLEHDVFDDDLLFQLALSFGVNTNQEREYVLADLRLPSTGLADKWREFKAKEREISEGLVEFKKLYSEINNGQSTYEEWNTGETGGSDEKSMREYQYCRISLYTKEDFDSCRDSKLTKALLKELNALSLSEIRNKYFPKEVVENE